MMQIKSRAVEKVEELYEKVRRLKRGGNLEGLLVEELKELNRLIYEEAIEERSKMTVSKETDFSP